VADSQNKEAIGVQLGVEEQNTEPYHVVLHRDSADDHKHRRQARERAGLDGPQHELINHLRCVPKLASAPAQVEDQHESIVCVEHHRVHDREVYHPEEFTGEHWEEVHLYRDHGDYYAEHESEEGEEPANEPVDEAGGDDVDAVGVEGLDRAADKAGEENAGSEIPGDSGQPGELTEMSDCSSVEVGPFEGGMKSFGDPMRNFLGESIKLRVKEQNERYHKKAASSLTNHLSRWKRADVM
jgi:hypothetical protein